MKRFAWFLFKSPQRKWVGWGTLWTDVVGYVSLFTSKPRIKNRDEKLWVCTGHLNRSVALLKYLVKSLAENSNIETTGLSVFDCGSTDIVNLEQEIKKIWKGELIFTSEKMGFTRAKAFNRAIAQAPGEVVFICDADMELRFDVAKMARKNVSAKAAWFPICQWQKERETLDWRWFTEGTGIFAATQTQLKKVGNYNEKFVQWGKEDWDLFFRFYENGIAPRRSRVKGLYHHWHSSSKPVDFVKWF